MKRTGLLLAGITVLIAACGPRMADVSIEDVDPPTTTRVADPAIGQGTTENLLAESDVRASEPDDDAPVADEQATSTSTIASNQAPSPDTTTTTTTAPVEIVLPDLSELDQLLADVGSLVDDIDLIQTEGDLP